VTFYVFYNGFTRFLELLPLQHLFLVPDCFNLLNYPC